MTARREKSIPIASLVDSARFLLGHFIPTYLEGTFLRNRFWTRVFDLFKRHPTAVRLYRRMREKYRTGLLYVRLGRSRVLLVNNDDAMDRVLANSPLIYADPPAKRKGMSHFQPGAVTIARGESWVERRALNEAVLATGRTHSLDADFHRLIVAETQSMFDRCGGQLVWQDVERTFGRISRQILFGESADDDYEVTELLRKLMRQANRLFWLRRGKRFDELMRRIDRYLDVAIPSSLVGILSRQSGFSREELKHQVPHWMFAMTDTLAENTARALLLLASNAKMTMRLHQADEASDSRPFLEACLAETMRLFPTTTTVGRNTLSADLLSVEIIPPGTQVLCLNTAWHRDPIRFPEPHAFRPQRFSEGSDDKSLFFGGGNQRCAGADLAVRIGTAFLHEVFATHEIQVRRPNVAALDELPFRLNPFRMQCLCESAPLR